MATPSTAVYPACFNGLTTLNLGCLQARTLKRLRDPFFGPDPRPKGRGYLNGTALAKTVQYGVCSMKNVMNRYTLVLFLLITAVPICAQVAEADAKRVASDFERRVREYTKQRGTIENRLPKLSDKSSATEIAAYKQGLLQGVLTERKGIARGSVFTPAAEQLIRSTIASQYKGRDRTELRKELAAAENATVPVKVNAVYPEKAELLEMPPTLLLALPQLPKQVRYRFVGTSLLLVDRENHLIIDYMANALP